jgi:AcrR family transcriptional regulator
VDQRILDATIDLFAEVGFEGLTFERVAARAGVGKPSVYRRYGSKLDLALAAITSISEHRVLYRDTGDSRNDLRAFMSDLLSIFLETATGKILPSMIAEGNRTPELAARYHGFTAERRVALKAALRRCISRGDLAETSNLDLVADFLTAPIYLRLLVTGDPLNDKFIDETVDATLRAFGPDPNRRSKPGRTGTNTSRRRA